MALRKPQHGAQRTSVPGSPSVQLEHELVGVAPEPVLTGLKGRSEEHTSELQSQSNLVCRLLLEKKKHSRGIHHHGQAFIVLVAALCFLHRAVRPAPYSRLHLALVPWQSVAGAYFVADDSCRPFS